MLTKNGIPTLLSRFAIEQGYCELNERMLDNLPCTIEAYTNAIVEADGFTAGLGGDLWRNARRIVTEVFEKYYED